MTALLWLRPTTTASCNLSSPTTGEMMICASLEMKNKHLGIICKLFAEPEPKRAEHLSGLLSTDSLNDLIKCFFSAALFTS
ncbi:hypothetical protein C8J56DRAFT_1037299 [Mycena floridula]|nr:hypothetical protein C8J56DRAFT_1037299 [Mycena floridula]